MVRPSVFADAAPALRGDAAAHAPPPPTLAPAPFRRVPMAGYRGHLFGATLFFALYFAALVAVFAVDAAYTRFSTLEQVG